jgi:hypothetical protein
MLLLTYDTAKIRTLFMHHQTDHNKDWWRKLPTEESIKTRFVKSFYASEFSWRCSALSETH